MQAQGQSDLASFLPTPHLGASSRYVEDGFRGGSVDALDKIDNALVHVRDAKCTGSPGCTRPPMHSLTRGRAARSRRTCMGNCLP